MVYRRKRNFKPYKRTGRRRAPYKRLTTRALISRTHESKYVQGIIANANATNTGAVTALTMPSQGDTVQSRDGDKVQWAGLNGIWTTTAGDTYNLVRFALIQWHPDNAIETPAINTLLQDVSTYITISPWILDKSKRSKFKVLYEKLAVVNTAGNLTNKYNIRIPGKKMGRSIFNNAVQTGKNTLYYFYISDSGAVTHPTISFSITYRFKDY